MEEKIAVIAVNYENYQVTEEFIDSFKDQTDKNFHLFIADQSANKKEFRPSKYVTIVIADNGGFAHGFNLALKKAIDEGYEVFTCIGNDTRVSDLFVEAALKSHQAHPSSIIGAKIYYEKGFEYHDRYKPEELGHVLWFAGGVVDWAHVHTKHRGVDEVDRGQYDKFEEMDFITGCVLLFDKTVFEKVGFWDEKYFLYYEDADFCERAKRAGIKLYYDPSIVIWHKNAQSAGGSGSSLQQKYQEKSRLRLGLKFAPWRTKLHLIKNYFLYKLKKS